MTAPELGAAAVVCVAEAELVEERELDDELDEELEPVDVDDVELLDDVVDVDTDVVVAVVLVPAKLTVLVIPVTPWVPEPPVTENIGE
jgi:hypothetical protein